MNDKKKDLFFIQDKKRYCLDALANSLLTPKEAVDFLNCSFYVLLFFIREEYKKTQSEVLKQIIISYSEIPFFESKNISEKSLNLQKEIVMVALTYRISIANLCQLFETSYDDIEKVFDNFPFYSFPFYILNLETMNENKKFEALAFKKGKHYFLKAKELRTLKIKAIRNGDDEKVEVLNEKIRSLQTEIYDNAALALQNNEEILLSDLLLITQYRIKYGLSRNQCTEIFGVKESRLREYENKLIEKDDYYSEKLYFLNEFQDKHSKLDRGIFKR